MIYYVPLLMIDDFDYSIIEKFDELLQCFAKSKSKNLTPRYVSNKLKISELSATKLLSQSEKVGLVKIEYTMKCISCGAVIKTNMIKTNNRTLCKSCNLINRIKKIKNVYFHYLVLVR